MDEIMSSLLVIAIGVYGILLMLGGVTDNPWRFASRPYRWLFRTMQNIVQNTLRRSLRLLGRTLQGLVNLMWSGIITFCRRFPKTATTLVIILILGTIAVIVLAQAGFI